MFSTRILGSILQGLCRFQLHLSEWEETSFIQFSRVWLGVRGENSGGDHPTKNMETGDGGRCEGPSSPAGPLTPGRTQAEPPSSAEPQLNLVIIGHIQSS